MGVRPQSQSWGRRALSARVAVSEQGVLHSVPPDPADPDPATVKRLVLCSGKFAHELLARPDGVHPPVAIVRLEQLYPWPEREIAEGLPRFPNAEILWAQEEPGNMCARYLARRTIEEMC